MINSEILLRTIFGPIRSDIRPLAFAVDITDDLLFTRHIPMDDIRFTKHVYPDVAKLLHRKPGTTSRCIERLAHLCWDALNQQGQVFHYLGRSVPYPPDPCQLLVFLAVYAHLHVPFFTVVEQCPQFLFQSVTDTPSLPAAQDDAIVKALQRTQPLSVSQSRNVVSSQGSTTFPVCPNCLKTLEREYQTCCDRCGQRLDWEQYQQH